MVSINDKVIAEIHLSAGNIHDSKEGNKSLAKLRKFKGADIAMDKAYEGKITQYFAKQIGLNPVTPPKSNRRNPWEYDKEKYKRRNEIERVNRRIKGFRRVFTRYDKLDKIFLSVVKFTFCIIWLFSVNTP